MKSITTLFLMFSVVSATAQTTASAKRFKKDFNEADSVAKKMLGTTTMRQPTLAADTLIDYPELTRMRFEELGKQITNLNQNVSTLTALREDILRTVMETQGKDPAHWELRGYDEISKKLIVKPIQKEPSNATESQNVAK